MFYSIVRLTCLVKTTAQIISPAFYFEQLVALSEDITIGLIND